MRFSGIGFLVGLMAGMTDSRELVEAAASVLVGTLTGAIVDGMLTLPVYLNQSVRHCTYAPSNFAGMRRIGKERTVL